MMRTFATMSNSYNRVRSPRITHQELRSLKSVAAQEQPASVKFFKSLQAELASLLSALFTPRQSRKMNDSMCRYYGHIIRGPWEGHLPTCADCGSVIQSADQLRKAQAECPAGAR